MMKYARKNQLKQAEMQGNELQIVSREAGSRKMTKQFEKKHLKQLKNQSQSGRSMIEMLGVLAIIAILSIGGIVGFRLAMNYYQANQITHEMNIMRTDAQIKIAQGAEKLMLGDPYDSGNIQFNGYKTDFDCLYLETETSTPDDVASCAVANAYYIELLEIPEGVCKPLANLIDKMDNEIAFYINDKSVDATEEKGACSEGLNTLKVIFGADSNSNAVKCDTDAECESLESTPVCDETRHVCVECTEDDDCPYNTDYCEDNVCKTCDSGVWNGEECVECTTDDDCTDTPDTPKCNITTNQCVECLTYSDCTDTPETPQCDETSHTCKSCAEIDPEKPLWADNECKACPANKPWNGESCGCRNNDDCNTNEFEFCNTYNTSECGKNNLNQFPDQGSCEQISYEKITVEDKGIYYISKNPLDFWSAERFCQVVGDKELNEVHVPSTEELGCPANLFSWCPDDSLQKSLQNTKEWNTDIHIWTNTIQDECIFYGIRLCDGYTYGFFLHHDYAAPVYALCVE